MSSNFDDFMREMEEEAGQAGPQAEAAFFESQQRHWIGRRLFERRRELGYTQAKVAQLSGINQADISKIEHAEANPTLDTLGALASALGLSLTLEPVSKQMRALGAPRKATETADRIIDVTATGRLQRGAAAGKRSTSDRAGKGGRPAAVPKLVDTSPSKRRR